MIACSDEERFTAMQAYMAIESPKQIGDCRESPMPDLFVKAVPEFPIVVGTDPNVGFESANIRRAEALRIRASL